MQTKIKHFLICNSILGLNYRLLKVSSRGYKKCMPYRIYASPAREAIHYLHPNIAKIQSKPTSISHPSWWHIFNPYNTNQLSEDTLFFLPFQQLLFLLHWSSKNSISSLKKSKRLQLEANIVSINSNCTSLRSIIQIVPNNTMVNLCPNIR